MNPLMCAGPTLYNAFPSIEDASKSASVKTKEMLLTKIGAVIPENVGITITHAHHVISEGELVVGKIEEISGKPTLVSKVTVLSNDISPTTWVATKSGLIATEGIQNATQAVIEIAKKVQEATSKIFPILFEESQEFSQYSISINPGFLLGEFAVAFLETTDADGTSILSALDEPLSQQSGIETFLGFMPNAKTTKVFCKVFCNSNPKPDHSGYHYSKHRRVTE